MNEHATNPSLPWPQVTLPAADILIVGLGPGGVGNIPLAVWQALHQAPQVILRTRRHPGVEELARHVDLESCDDLYQEHAAFPDVYAAIAERVLARAREGQVVYATPGHPWVGEATTRLILEGAQEAGLTAAVLGGASFLEPSFGAVQVDPMDGGQVMDAMLLAQRHHPPLELGQPALLGQLYARWLASDVKLTLMNAYPDDHPVTLIRAAGAPEEQLETLPLFQLDRREGFDHLTSLFLPPLPQASFTELQEIVAHLRAPEGCPWDRQQTLESLRSDLLDEAAEVLEAIDEGDDAHVAEELGDLLLIVTMMTQIATEEGRFRMADVVRHIVQKLIRRHPHVFGDVEVAGVEDVFRNWNAIKAQERAAKGQAPQKSPLDQIPAALPALEKARKLQSKAEKVGLLDRTALAQEDPRLQELLPPDANEEALGRLLWRLVALARERGLNPENALASHLVRWRRAHADEGRPAEEGG